MMLLANARRPRGGSARSKLPRREQRRRRGCGCREKRECARWCRMGCRGKQLLGSAICLLSRWPSLALRAQHRALAWHLYVYFPANTRCCCRCCFVCGVVCVFCAMNRLACTKTLRLTSAVCVLGMPRRLHFTDAAVVLLLVDWLKPD